MPPSLEVLEQRLRGRGTETEEVVQQRLNEALTEISKAYEYDYICLLYTSFKNSLENK